MKTSSSPSSSSSPLPDTTMKAIVSSLKVVAYFADLYLIWEQATQHSRTGEEPEKHVWGSFFTFMSGFGTILWIAMAVVTIAGMWFMFSRVILKRPSFKRLVYQVSTLNLVFNGETMAMTTCAALVVVVEIQNHAMYMVSTSTKYWVLFVSIVTFLLSFADAQYATSPGEETDFCRRRLLGMEIAINAVAAFFALILIIQSMIASFFPGLGLIFCTPVAVFAYTITAIISASESESESEEKENEAEKERPRFVTTIATYVVLITQMLAWPRNPERKLHAWSINAALCLVVFYVGWVYATLIFDVRVHFRISAYLLLAVTASFDFIKTWYVYGVSSFPSQSFASPCAVAFCSMAIYGDVLGDAVARFENRDTKNERRRRINRKRWRAFLTSMGVLGDVVVVIMTVLWDPFAVSIDFFVIWTSLAVSLCLFVLAVWSTTTTTTATATATATAFRFTF